MITKSKAFLTSDNQVFLTQEEAQKHEIEILPGGCDSIPATGRSEWVMAHKAELLAILSTRKPRTPKAKPAKKAKPAVAMEAA